MTKVTCIHKHPAAGTDWEALVRTHLSVVGFFLVARIPVLERRVGHDRLVTWHRKVGPWSLYLIGAHVFLIVLGCMGKDQIRLYRAM